MTVRFYLAQNQEIKAWELGYRCGGDGSRHYVEFPGEPSSPLILNDIPREIVEFVTCNVTIVGWFEGRDGMYYNEGCQLLLITCDTGSDRVLRRVEGRGPTYEALARTYSLFRQYPSELLVEDRTGRGHQVNPWRIFWNQIRHRNNVVLNNWKRRLNAFWKKVEDASAYHE